MEQATSVSEPVAVPPRAELRGISKRFAATQALDDVSLTLVPGQRVTMRRAEPFGGPLTVDVEGSEHAISRELAERIGVS